MFGAEAAARHHSNRDAAALTLDQATRPGTCAEIPCDLEKSELQNIFQERDLAINRFVK